MDSVCRGIGRLGGGLAGQERREVGDGADKKPKTDYTIVKGRSRQHLGRCSWILRQTKPNQKAEVKLYAYVKLPI